jgi:hypothetical protein
MRKIGYVTQSARPTAGSALIAPAAAPGINLGLSVGKLGPAAAPWSARVLQALGLECRDDRVSHGFARAFKCDGKSRQLKQEFLCLRRCALSANSDRADF